MKIQEYKACERENVQRILAWQIAQILGYDSEETTMEHAVLLLVDYDEDRYYPQMVGKYFRTSLLPDESDGRWSAAVRVIVENFVDERNRSEIMKFWSENAVRRKYQKNRCFDSVDYISLTRDAPRWTHAVQYLLEDPDNHHLMCYCWTIEVDHFLKNQNAIDHMAHHDQLTGLYNRHRLNEFMAGFPLQRIGNGAVFIMMDINLFKHINDDYGHHAGDMALMGLANKLESVFFHKQRDLIFRLGGDEFLVIMLDATEKQALACMDKLIDPMTIHLDSATEFEISVSIGYSICHSNTENPAEHLNAADRALYLVKEHGRHGYMRAK